MYNHQWATELHKLKTWIRDFLVEKTAETTENLIAADESLLKMIKSLERRISRLEEKNRPRHLP